MVFLRARRCIPMRFRRRFCESAPWRIRVHYAALLIGLVLSAMRSAEVRAQPLRVTATAALAFGTTAPLKTKTIAPADAGAGVFSLQGTASSTVNVLVAMPDQLIGTSQWVRTTAWNATITTLAGTSATSLASGVEISVTLGTDGLATLRVGASIAPPMTVGSGTFSGTLTLVARSASEGFMSLTAQNAVSATIRQPLVLNAVPMEFGAVYVNTAKTLAPTDPNAMRLLIDGDLGASVDVVLESAPTTLARTGGGATLAIGTWRTQNGGAQCTGSATTPTVGATVSLSLSSSVGSFGRTSYCLGGTVTPSAIQMPGTYTGAVVISVRYTGA